MKERLRVYCAWTRGMRGYKYYFDEAEELEDENGKPGRGMGAFRDGDT